MDVVYVVRPGERNEELRHSIRSVERNIHHDDITIVGHKPAWLDANHIPVQQRYAAYANMRKNWEAIAANDALSPDIIYFNDDMFAMRTTDVPVFHRGNLVDHIAKAKRANGPGGYTRLLSLSLQLLNQWAVPPPYYSYTSHCPVILTRAKMGALMRRLDHIKGSVLLRTLYGNLFWQDGIEAPDFKVSGTDAASLQRVLDRHDGNPLFLSTSDLTFSHGHVGKVLRARFDEPSRRELSHRMR